jgi:hypothetical protein
VDIFIPLTSAFWASQSETLGFSRLAKNLKIIFRFREDNSFIQVEAMFYRIHADVLSSVSKRALPCLATFRTPAENGPVLSRQTELNLKP